MKNCCSILWLSLLFLSGCQAGSSNVEVMEILRDEALIKSRDDIPVVSQFIELFPGSNDYIYYFKVDGRDPIFSAENHFGGQFIIRARLNVEYDYSNGDVLSYGDPDFVIEEIKSLERNKNGNWMLRHGRTIRFEKDKWNEFYESGGDFSVLELNPESFTQIEGWVDYINEKFPPDSR